MSSRVPAPDTDRLNGHWILGEILDHISEFVDDFPSIDFSHLNTLISDVRNHKADTETQLRLFLKVFRKTKKYKQAFKLLDPQVRQQIDNFIESGSASEVTKSGFEVLPSPAAIHHFKALNTHHFKALKSIFRWEHAPKIYEDKARTKVMEVHADKAFENWGLSVQNKPKFTFIPTTILGLENLVRYAKRKGLRVRCSGYRHSWSPLFSADEEILVSLLNIQQVTQVPDPTSLFPTPQSNALNELKSIQIDDLTVASRPGNKCVRVGAAVTADEFRRWLIAHNTWALPVDVILVEQVLDPKVTTGGVNAPICHGAGHRHKTVSDQVRSIEYVDANGVHQTISDPELLKAAAGCFGLLGIVTHITLELQPMSYPVMRPEKPDINLAIPPLKPEDVPHALQKDFTPEQLAEATKRFEERAGNDYYSEFFWFPFQQQAWVNCWNPVDNQEGAEDYPPTAEVWLQWIQGWLGGVIIETEFFKAIPGRWQAEFLATLTMAALPPQFFGKHDAEIKTFMPDALHFRRGIQNMRCRDMEFQIPIPSRKDDPSKPDWTIVQRAWWDVINVVYSDPESPMRLTLELRIMADSDMIMAPQRGNKHGTASIEVLSIPDAVSDGEWQPFLQLIADKWMSYESIYGQKLNVRPHWCKEWDGLNLGGIPAREYIKTVAYKDEIPEFRDILRKIGDTQGWGLEDIKKMFSNELWDQLVFDTVQT